MADNPGHNSGEEQQALNFAYMYGYPWLEYGKFVRAIPGAATNTLYHDRRLSTSDDLKVIRPNVDTLYTIIFLDLSSHDIAITIPDIRDRYWVFPFYDPYGNDIGNIGSLQGHKAGKYLIRFSNLDFGFFRGAPPGHESHLDEYNGYINLPTAYGISIARIATTPEKKDQELANNYQDQIQITPIQRSIEAVAPPLDFSVFDLMKDLDLSNMSSVAEAVLQLTAAFAPYNQSPVLKDRAKISGLLAKSGIANGVFSQPPNVRLSEPYAFAHSQAHAFLQSSEGVLHVGKGWSCRFYHCLGSFGSNYAARFSTAARGYLALTSDQAIYPSPPSAFTLGPKQALLLRFRRRPVLVPTGFWSLTVYDEKQYLVRNKLGRYCLGDRDKLAFTDGRPLSDDTKDGEFNILLQPADIEPPEEWLSNWLPAPVGGGKMSITLRWYGATGEMVDGGYEYPTIEYVEAILGSHKSLL